MSRHIVSAVQKVRRQKQRPTAERIRHMLERDEYSLTSSELDQLLNLAVSSGAVERIYNSSGVVSYKELTINSSISSPSVAASKSSSDAPPVAYKVESKPKPKNSEVPAKESKKADKKLADKKPPSRHMHVSSVCHETVSPDCKPTVVVDKHTDLSDVVLQVILRLGSASGKALEKNLRSHYRLDIYPGVDIRRNIRTACKSLVRQEQLRQEGNNFVLMGDDDDAADVTLMVDKPTTAAADKSIETQVVAFYQQTCEFVAIVALVCYCFSRDWLCCPPECKHKDDIAEFVSRVRADIISALCFAVMQNFLNPKKWNFKKISSFF